MALFKNKYETKVGKCFLINVVQIKSLLYLLCTFSSTTEYYSNYFSRAAIILFWFFLMTERQKKKIIGKNVSLCACRNENTLFMESVYIFAIHLYIEIIRIFLHTSTFKFILLFGSRPNQFNLRINVHLFFNLCISYSSYLLKVVSSSVRCVCFENANFSLKFNLILFSCNCMNNCYISVTLW